MDSFSVLFLLAVLLLETVSHLALKSASSHVARLDGLHFVKELVGHPGFWIAVVTFFLLFLSWLAFLARVPLSTGVMVGSITIVGVMLGGRLWFHERITPARSLAIGLIACGVALVGIGAP
jgi:drug/metabolite transporter (DMT)-like permease